DVIPAISFTYDPILGKGTVQTSRAHYLAPLDYVLVAGAGSGWDGYFQVTATNNSREFVISPTPAPTGNITSTTASLGPAFHGAGALGPYGARSYGNRVV